MYNTDLVKIHKMKSGNIGIEAPFNGSFKDELQAMIPSARWQSPYWTIKSASEEQANELLARYYPPQDQLQKVCISWVLDRESPKIDGIDLASVSRDWWSWSKRCMFNFKVIEQDLSSGGSVKYPGLYGTLVIETMIRPDADISPAAELLLLEEGKAHGSLSGFSTEELLAELQMRTQTNQEKIE